MAVRSIPHWHNRTREGVKALLNKISLKIYNNLKKIVTNIKKILRKNWNKNKIKIKIKIKIRTKSKVKKNNNKNYSKTKSEKYKAKFLKYNNEIKNLCKKIGLKQFIKSKIREKK